MNKENATKEGRKKKKCREDQMIWHGFNLDSKRRVKHITFAAFGVETSAGIGRKRVEIPQNLKETGCRLW